MNIQKHVNHVKHDRKTIKIHEWIRAHKTIIKSYDRLGGLQHMKNQHQATKNNNDNNNNNNDNEYMHSEKHKTNI